MHQEKKIYLSISSVIDHIHDFISDISVAMLKYHDQKQLKKSLFWLTLPGCLMYRTAGRHGDEGRKLRNDISVAHRKKRK